MRSLLSEAERLKYRAKVQELCPEFTVDDKKIIGERIKDKRNDYKMTRDDVAAILDVNAKTIMRIENGSTKTFPYEMLRKLAVLFDCTIPDFLPNEPEQPANHLESIDDFVLKYLLIKSLRKLNRHQTG